MSSYYIIDTETHDKNEPEVIQVSLITSQGESYNAFARPKSKVKPAATVVHGIPNNEAQDFPQKEETSAELQKVLTKLYETHERPIYCIGHNISFDINALDNLLPRFAPKNTICTMSCATRMLPINEIGGASLDAVHYYFYENIVRLKELRIKHDALVDVKLTEELLVKFIELAPDGTIDSLYEFSKIPIELQEWPMGKYKGQKLDPFDSNQNSYCHWLIKQDWAEEKYSDLLYTIELRFGIKK